MMLDDEAFLYFTDRALDGMAAVVTELGDELANATPDLPGANSPFAILTHCLGVADFWAGRLVAGRDVRRDRAAEFTAAGHVADLVARVDVTKRRLRDDLAAADHHAPPREDPPPHYRDTPPGATQGGALQHVLEELCQHHGQLELTRDVLLASRR